MSKARLRLERLEAQHTRLRERLRYEVNAEKRDRLDAAFARTADDIEVEAARLATEALFPWEDNDGG